MIVIACPMASSVSYPKMRCAAGFQDKITPSKVLADDRIIRRIYD